MYFDIHMWNFRCFFLILPIELFYFMNRSTIFQYAIHVDISSSFSQLKKHDKMIIYWWFIAKTSKILIRFCFPFKFLMKLTELINLSNIYANISCWKRIYSTVKTETNKIEIVFIASFLSRKNKFVIEMK